MIFDKKFDEIEIDTITSLIAAGIQEGLNIEYKSQPYGAKDIDKKEFLKDISAFANTNGGHIIIGIQESEGIPIEILV